MTTRTGRTVAVTGAAGGIGRAIATAFVRAGDRVALADRDEGGVRQVAAELGPAAEAATVDVRDPDSVDAWAGALSERWGAVDVVVANAGIYPSHRLLDMPVDAWDEVLAVNLRGAFLTCQRFARDMVDRSVRGSIVTIASGSSRFAREGAAHYGASKAGLVALTRTMALELGPHGIRVNAVSPGIVDVPGGPQLGDAYRRAMTSLVPAGRMGTPEDVAAAVLAVVDPGMDYLTGHELRLDGGLSAGRFGIPTSGTMADGTMADGTMEGAGEA